MFRRRRRQEPEDDDVHIHIQSGLPRGFDGTRDEVFAVDPADIGIQPTDEHPAAWGALMEIGYPEASVTLLALADGTANLYFNGGVGKLGCGAHESVAKAGQAFVRRVGEYLERIPASDDISLPEQGWVTIRALTYAGRGAVQAYEEDLGFGWSDLSPVFYAGQEVLTQIRVVG